MNEVLKRKEQDLLLVVDSVKEYFDNPSCMQVRSGLANYCMQRGKSCLSVLADMGCVLLQVYAIILSIKILHANERILHLS
jgi:hypothetical protein